MQHRPLAQRRAGIPRFVWARGIYLGWWIAGAITLVSFARVPFFNPVLGIFIGPLEDEFGWSRATIGGALSAGTLAGAAAAPFLGRYVDRYGGRYFMVGGIILVGLLLILLSVVQEVWQFYILYGLGRALAIVVIDMAILVTIANWFIRHRGRALGLSMVGMRGGMAVIPLIVLLFISLFDWRAAFAALGVLAIVIAVLPAWLVVRRRPEDVGLRPDGDRATTLRATEGREPFPAAADDPRWTVREAIRTRPFWLLLFGTAQLFMVSGAVNLSLVPHLEDNGLSRTTAIIVISVWAVMGVVGGMLGGEVRQRVAIRYALPVVLCFTASAVVWLIFVDRAWMAYLFAVWHGLAFGVQLPLHQISFPDYFGRWSVGAIRGVTAPVQFGFNAAGPLLVGIVFDARGSYDLIFAIFVGLLMLAAVLIFLAKPPRLPATDELQAPA